MACILLLKDNYPLFDNSVWNDFQKKIENTPELDVFFKKVSEEETEKFRELGDEFCNSFPSEFMEGVIREAFFDKVNRHYDKLVQAMCSVDGWDTIFKIKELDEVENPTYTIIRGDYPSGDQLILPSDLRYDVNYKGIERNGEIQGT